MRQQNIPIQDPSLSPTFNLSTLPQATSPTHPRRRNLFARRAPVEPFSVSHSPTASRSASPPKPSIIATDAAGRPQLPELHLPSDSEDEAADPEPEPKYNMDLSSAGDFHRIEGVLAEMQRLQKARASGVKTRKRREVRGVGDTLKEGVKEEILGLIMASLRKRYIEAEEEAWMFGDERPVADASGCVGVRLGPDGEEQ